MTIDAETFHALAAAELGRLGFMLINDPSQRRGRYSDASADYECPRRLRLSVGFENDSGNALVFFGRLWLLQQGHTCLSNHYAMIARRFGINTPMSYPLSCGQQRTGQIAAILTDLKRTLPEVMKRVTLDDLIHVEREKFGAESIAGSQLEVGFDRLF